MSSARPKKAEKSREDASSASVDPVLSHLKQAEQTYEELLLSWEQNLAELKGAEEAAKRAKRDKEKLAEKVAALKAQLDQEQKKAAAQKEKASQLTGCLKDIQRSLFDGNIYSLILRACLTATGGTRGLYLTARGPEDKLQIRAAVDVDGYPSAPPSDFIQSLCHKALSENNTIVCKQGEMSDLPEPSKPSEQFHNCAVAPVVLMQHFDGIIIVADKVNGDFNEDDVETLLSVGDQAAVAIENVRLQRELQRAYLATVSMLADAVEAKDPHTHGHCEMVSRYARLVANRLNLADHDSSVVCYAALLHDVGKIGVSDGVLNKPGPLSPEERELVRSHVRVGHDLINKVPALDAVADVVLHHHEWYDGTGYPDGLKGEKIPLASRIVCVVDAYCAMVTKRSYKEAYSDARARAELERCAGTQFDPKVVKVFLEMLDSAESEDMDDDDAAECGVLPGFGHIRELQYSTL